MCTQGNFWFIKNPLQKKDDCIDFRLGLLPKQLYKKMYLEFITVFLFMWCISVAQMSLLFSTVSLNVSCLWMGDRTGLYDEVKYFLWHPMHYGTKTAKKYFEYRNDKMWHVLCALNDVTPRRNVQDRNSCSSYHKLIVWIRFANYCYTFVLEC